MKSAILVLGLGLGLAMTTACSKKSSKSPTSTAAETQIKLTGTLALTGTTGLRLAEPAVTDLSVYCVSFTLPPVAGTGAVAADGKFSVTLDTAGVSVGCFILDAAKTILGTMVFKDQTKKDLNGAAQADDRFALEGGESDLGAITLNLTTGKAEVDVAQIKGKVKDTASAVVGAYNFTGSYVFEDSGVTPPEGYFNLCTEAEEQQSRQDEQNGGQGNERCNGPVIGMPIYVKRIDGVVPGTSTPNYAMSFWASKEYDQLCGNKLGVTYADAVANGIDPTNSGVGSGDFTWDPNYADGWKNTAGARARFSLMKQETVADFQGYPGFKQYFHHYRTWTCGPNQPCVQGDPVAAEGFTFNANSNDSGCRTPDGKPIMLDDWSNMTCQNENLKNAAGANTGLNKNVCKKTVDAKEITCTHIGGSFLANGTPLQNANTKFPEDFTVFADGPFCDYNNNNVFDPGEQGMGGGNGEISCNNNQTPDPGTLCSAINVTTNEGKLAQLRCYAEDLHNNKNGDDEMSSCRRDVRTNWSAKTPEEFVIGGKSRPQGQFIFEKLKYDSPTSASLRGEETDVRGINTGNGWTDCEMNSVFSFSLRKIEGSEDLYGEMVQTETNVSPKPACIAEYGASKPSKFMFKMKKTGT